MKIVNFKKFIRSIIIVFILFTGISFIITKSTYSHSQKEYMDVYVENGDTLWSIAQNLQSTNYYKNKDIRYIVNNVKEENNLKNSDLQINQKLKIPTN